MTIVFAIIPSERDRSALTFAQNSNFAAENDYRAAQLRDCQGFWCAAVPSGNESGA